MVARDDDLGNLPAIVIDPLDMAGLAQGFQPSDMEADEGLGILALLDKRVADARKLPTRKERS
jgi:hypothetical protein